MLSVSKEDNSLVGTARAPLIIILQMACKTSTQAPDAQQLAFGVGSVALQLRCRRGAAM